MISILLRFSFLLYFLPIQLQAQVTPENDTARFKINPTSFEDPTNFVKAMELYWDNSGTNAGEVVVLVANLGGEKFGNIWFWQTYSFFYAESCRWKSPRLPKDCKVLNMAVRLTPNAFIFNVFFDGFGCRALPEILKLEKIHIEYVNVKIIDETTIAPLIHFYLDDLPEVIRSFSI